MPSTKNEREFRKGEEGVTGSEEGIT